MYYDVVYINDGLKITKVQENDISVKIVDSLENEYSSLSKNGQYYVIFSDIWEITEQEVIVQVFDGDVLLKSSTYGLSIKKDGTESIIIEYSNGQLGDLISWTPHVLRFLKVMVNQFSNFTIRLKLHSFIAIVFECFGNPSCTYDNNGDLKCISYLGGKIILEDISIVEQWDWESSFDVTIRIGMVDIKDYIHPYGINICNQLGIDMDLDSRFMLEEYYNGIGTDKKHVCIAPYGTMKAKMWLSYDCELDKWQRSVDFLVNSNYEVWWISKEICDLVNVIDLSGESYSIDDRIEQLIGCSFFIGGASGLSWLANACGVHVFRINTWSWGWTEFRNNVTIIENNNGCRGCFNDGSLPKSEFHWNYCPREMDFQCSKTVSLQKVINAVEGFLNGNNL